MSRVTRLQKLLIANRGEVARRVIRTAHAMGIATVAVYSDADANALHVREASCAVALGGSASADSYLRIDKLLVAARETGADAVHPGYGFLSESAEFAQAVIDAGLTWVGPPPAAIRALGSKSAAKQLALSQGVPCLPGYHGADQDEATLQAEAQRIGLPLMVKAVAGGGGRGMRLVTETSQLLPALRSARSEALAGFGNGDLLLERALLNPRHVEVQVFADAHGHCIHLGERDCSVQRRHQKIIEESPSPAVSPALRAELGRCAVALAQGAGYVGAGTVEFLLDEQQGEVPDAAAGFAAGPPQGETRPLGGQRPASAAERGGSRIAAGQPQGETRPLGGQRPAQRRSVGASFYLMEMNTRLQVEHPVTEMLTGLDLVEWQLRIARGESLPLTQEQVRLDGHAIEVRLCAEDEHFTPHTGEVLHFEAPPCGAPVRFDHALERGAVVTPHYDAMLGKLIAHAPTRDQAIDRLTHALADTVVLGLPTNRGFLAACLDHPVFRAGKATIPFLQQHGDDVRAALNEASVTREIVGALAVTFAGTAPAQGLACPYPRSLRLAWGDEIRAFSVQELGAGQVRVRTVDGGDSTATVHGPHAGRQRIVLDGVSGEVHAVRVGEQRWHVQVSAGNAGQTSEAWIDDLSHTAATAGGAGAQTPELRAPFNGKLLGVHVRPGQTVAKGETLLVIESMKLEHSVAAPRDAVVAEVLVQPGQQVAPGQVLLRFQP
jgi:geranyl-CoA carboxylase alpha subunit